MLRNEDFKAARGISLGRSMILVAILAADMTALPWIGQPIPNPGIALMVVVLEVGLWRATSRSASIRAEWVGFQVVGWTYVLIHWIFYRTIWRWTLQSFLLSILGQPVIMTQGERWALFLLAGCVQLAVSLTLAMLGGAIAGRVWGAIRGEERPRTDRGEMAGSSG